MSLLLLLLQGGHIFEKLNSLSFPRVFLEISISKLFPEQLKRENLAGIQFHWHLCQMCYIFPEFSIFFPQKFKFRWVFPEILPIFSDSLNYPGFPRFSKLVATLSFTNN